MQILQYTNARGESVTLGNSKPYILSHVDGIGGTEVGVNKTRSPYQDGSTVTGIYLEDRLITIQGAIMARLPDEMYELRRHLSGVLNPKHGIGRLVYTNNARSYAIDAIVEQPPVYGDRFSTNQLFTMEFLCPDPYWRDVSETVKPLRFLVGGLTFPFKPKTSFATTEYQGEFVNRGDEETPIIIHYQGPAVNPKIENVITDEFIKVNYVLSETDVLEINTAFGKKRVEVVAEDGTRTNVFNWIDLDSTFFQLIPGVNRLKYTSDEETDQEQARVTIFWNNRYTGG